MPFIKQNLRKEIDEKGLSAAKAVGDKCYYFYKGMVDRWKEEPRWTTAHNIYKDLVYERDYLPRDEKIAYDLAWQVFFQLYVMPYELKKREENGDI